MSRKAIDSACYIGFSGIGTVELRELCEGVASFNYHEISDRNTRFPLDSKSPYCVSDEHDENKCCYVVKFSHSIETRFVETRIVRTHPPEVRLINILEPETFNDES